MNVVDDNCRHVAEIGADGITATPKMVPWLFLAADKLDPWCLTRGRSVRRGLVERHDMGHYQYPFVLC